MRYLTKTIQDHYEIPKGVALAARQAQWSVHEGQGSFERPLAVVQEWADAQIHDMYFIPWVPELVVQYSSDDREDARLVTRDQILQALFPTISGYLS